MQAHRRRNPYPQTWEIPLAVLVGLSLLLVLGVHLGRALANAIAGNGWVFVERAKLFTSLPGVLAGRADAGLVGIDSPASSSVLWASVLFVEILVLAVSAGCVRFGWGRWGPSRIRGTATRAEAEELLGVVRLRRHAHLIRPDLYSDRRGRHSAATRPLRNTTVAGTEGASS